MKFLRKLARHGNSSMVSIPPQVIDYLRWRGGDGIVLEVTTEDTVILRRMKPADTHVAVNPMQLPDAAPVIAR